MVSKDTIDTVLLRRLKGIWWEFSTVSFLVATEENGHYPTAPRTDSKVNLPRESRSEQGWAHVDVPVSHCCAFLSMQGPPVSLGSGLSSSSKDSIPASPAFFSPHAFFWC